MPDAPELQPHEGWAILELMGHRRLGGRISEARVGGAGFIRIDVPGEADQVLLTQFYAPQAIYCVTPTTEAGARRVAGEMWPKPATLLGLPDRSVVPDDDPDDDADDDENDDMEV